MRVNCVKGEGISIYKGCECKKSNGVNTRILTARAISLTPMTSLVWALLEIVNWILRHASFEFVVYINSDFVDRIGRINGVQTHGFIPACGSMFRKMTIVYRSNLSDTLIVIVCKDYFT